MFKHVLVPVDGSKLSLKAVKAAAALAKAGKSKLTLFHAAPDYGGVYYAESPLLAARITEPQFRAQIDEHARKLLEAAARAAGMPAELRHVISDYPHDAIVRAAVKYKCDLIVMASHGRRGIQGFLLGSETQKVLTHGKTPVLVIR